MRPFQSKTTYNSISNFQSAKHSRDPVHPANIQNSSIADMNPSSELQNTHLGVKNEASLNAVNEIIGDNSNNGAKN